MFLVVPLDLWNIPKFQTEPLIEAATPLDERLGLKSTAEIAGR